MITRQHATEFLRYGITGALCVMLNVIIVGLMTEYAGMHYLVSLALCSATVTIAGFFLNKSWTFRRHGTPIAPELLRYSLTTLGSMAVGLGSCALLVEKLHTPYLLAIAIVSVIFSPLAYLAHRGWSFGLSWLRGK